MFKSNRDYKLYIDDIVIECKNIKNFVDGVSYDEFTENLEKVYAVAKAFENEEVSIIFSLTFFSCSSSIRIY